MNVYLNNRLCYLIVEFLLGVRLEAALTSTSGLAAAVTRESHTHTVYPVSYTHLDVYKRQIGDRVEGEFKRN